MRNFAAQTRTQMKEMQFVALVLMTLLTMKLLVLPRRAASSTSLSRARWLMAGGTALLGVHFLLQYRLGLREMGVTQAVMLNLFLFIPASWLMQMAVIYLQRQGRIWLWDKLLGIIAWVLVIVLLGVAAAIDGQPLLSDTPQLHYAEVAASCCYLAMQGYYTWRQLSNLRAMRSALANYYDLDMNGLLRWMQLSIFILVILALMVPLLIFAPDYILAFFGVTCFAGIFYLVDSFCLYVVSTAPAKVMEAEQSEDESEHDDEGSSQTISDEALLRVESAVAQWTAAGGHLKNGLKLPNAAEEMHIPRYLLSFWLKQSGRHYSEWLTDLRIEEAKRVLLEHPEWSNEAVAQHCGFSDRCYFQKKFKEATGLTPAQFIA